MTIPSDFRLELYFARWEFTARHHMTASDAESLLVSELLAMADAEDRQAWEALALGYTQTRGAPALRATIASTYETLRDQDLLCFGGAQEGVWCAMNALLEPGDHIVVTAPNYQSMETIPLYICGAAGVTGVPLRLASGRWSFDPDEVRKALRPNTRAVAINFPNNPTGFVPPRDVFDALVSICAEHGIHLFSDEVYRGLERNLAHTLPQAADVYERGISLNVMSKAYGLPGLRIGWVACRDHALLDRMERMKHYMTICNSGPSEVLARIALKARKPIVERNRALCISNLEKLDQFFAQHRDLYEWRAPEGSCVGYPRFLGKEGVEEHCRALVEEDGVLLLPASIYQSDIAPVPDDCFRVGYGRQTMEAGLAAWRAHLMRRSRKAS